jgi:hypothetical protein
MPGNVCTSQHGNNQQTLHSELKLGHATPSSSSSSSSSHHQAWQAVCMASESMLHLGQISHRAPASHVLTNYILI